MVSFKKSLHLLTLFIVLISIFAPAQASAASISIAPLRQEITITPGQAFNSRLVVQNPSKNATTVTLSAEAFGIINEDYDYSFSKLEEVGKWLSFGSPQLILKPGESKSSSYILSVPNNAEPGEKYIAIFASVKNKSNIVTSIDRVGLLLYTTIAGNVTHKGEVLTSKIPTFSFDRQVSWGLRVHSTGSAHFRSKVVATVSDIFNHSISTSISEHLILPNTIRRLDNNIGIGGLPGIYKVKLLVGQGDDPAYKKTKWIIYFPLWSIALFIAIIGLIVMRIRRKQKQAALPVEKTVPESIKIKPAIKKHVKPKAKPTKKNNKSKRKPD